MRAARRLQRPALRGRRMARPHAAMRVLVPLRGAAAAACCRRILAVAAPQPQAAPTVPVSHVVVHHALHLAALPRMQLPARHCKICARRGRAGRLVTPRAQLHPAVAAQLLCRVGAWEEGRADKLTHKAASCVPITACTAHVVWLLPGHTLFDDAHTLPNLKSNAAGPGPAARTRRAGAAAALQCRCLQMQGSGLTRGVLAGVHVALIWCPVHARGDAGGWGSAALPTWHARRSAGCPSRQACCPVAPTGALLDWPRPHRLPAPAPPAAPSCRSTCRVPLSDAMGTATSPGYACSTAEGSPPMEATKPASGSS